MAVKEKEKGSFTADKRVRLEHGCWSRRTCVRASFALVETMEGLLVVAFRRSLYMSAHSVFNRLSTRCPFSANFSDSWICSRGRLEFEAPDAVGPGAGDNGWCPPCRSGGPEG